MASELIRWRHFISLKIQITFGGKNLACNFKSWGYLEDYFISYRKKIEIIVGDKNKNNE
jgi:hypothetical protein